MLNIGPQELLLILVLALLVVGPKRLPELGRSLGRGIRELRKAQDEVRKTIQINLDDDDPPPRRAATPLPVDDDAASTNGSAPSSGADTAAAAAAAASTSGPDTVPAVSEISRTLGRSLAELRRAREEIQRSFRVDLDEPSSPPYRPVGASESDRAADVSGRSTTDADERSSGPADAPAATESPSPSGGVSTPDEGEPQRPG